MITVEKRDGREVPFDRERIAVAVNKALYDTGAPDKAKADKLALDIENDLTEAKIARIGIKAIETRVEDKLMEISRDAARSYIEFRHGRDLKRAAEKRNREVFDLLNDQNDYITRENSNKNSKIISTKRDYMAGITSKEIAENIIFDRDLIEAHKAGIIHIHDMDYISMPMHNCFSKRTAFVTKDGVRRFSDFKDGDKVTVLDMYGDWRKATVHCYGRKQMQKIILTDGEEERHVTCTPDHRWITDRETVTIHLSEGMGLYPMCEKACEKTGRASHKWKVKEIRETRVEEAWCVEEPETHTFTLSGEVVTGNCSVWNLDDMLQNGTVMSEVAITKPKSLATAVTLTTQIVLQVASSQYGGQTFSIAHLAPFVRISKEKHLKEVRSELEGLNVPEQKIEEIASKRLDKEIKDAVQTLQYQLVSCAVSNGQAPFVSVFMWVNENPEYRDETVMLIKEILKQRRAGIPNRQGVPVSIAFPKLLYVLDETNTYEGQPYFWLTRDYAAPCTAERMVPDYISAKKMMEYKGDVFGCMGCVDGKSVIRYRIPLGDRFIEYHESFEKAWRRLSEIFPVSTQKNGRDHYINTPGVEIYDSKEGFVAQKRIIRNTQSDWVVVRFNDGTVIDATADHPFVVGGKVVRADHVREGDRMSGDRERTVDVVYAHEERKYAYDVTTESEHFEVNGVYSHNCRSFLTPDDFSDRIGNIANAGNYDGKHKYYGRFNQGVCTLNLPDVALSAKGDKKEFWKLLDERIDMCFRVLMTRHKTLLGTKSDVAPILWQNGALARLKPGEKIDPLLFDGYSTISLGYVGLYECSMVMTGKSNTTPEGKQFSLDVLKYLTERCAQKRAETNIAFSLYGTPEENTTDKFAKGLKRRFGFVEGATDHDYVTNSYHVNPAEEIDAFSKLRLEGEYQRYSQGGMISYVEVPNMTKNIPALIKIIQCIYENTMYGEVNTRSDYCQKCGFHGEMLMDENYDFYCPNCGNRDYSTMNITRRVCGYLSSNFPVSHGRGADLASRVLHISNR